VRGIVHAVDADQPITKFGNVAALVADSAAPQRIGMLLGGIFGMLALVLACTGVYGLISYAVVQRTHEIGVRMALGAPQRSIVRMVIAQGLGLAVAGLVIGLAAALAVGRLMSGLLFQVSPRDPVILAGVSVALLAMALTASYLPARRAAETDPLIALRRE
jgi:ABC-type antimicrobial peptide transport system permease subunit